jgi:hypothetical protein
MDLGNSLLPDQNLTGSFDVQVYLHAFKTSRRPNVANAIVPVSNLRHDAANYFSVNGWGAGVSQVTIPHVS